VSETYTCPDCGALAVIGTPHQCKSNRNKLQLIEVLRREFRLSTGHVYPDLNLSLLDEASLAAFVRLIRNLDSEKRSAMRRAQLQPWRKI